LKPPGDTGAAARAAAPDGVHQHHDIQRSNDMPRYVIQRTFPEGLGVPANVEGAAACRRVVESNTDEGVTWLHSYVSADDKSTFCVYDAPSPEAIRKISARNQLPVDKITQVRVLDPYFAG
jgi:hypothetical protein